MNAPVVARSQSTAVPALQITEDELIDVLQSSVYPGAKLGSIKLVINACRASGKDPLKKPYHIVPMSVATGRKDNNGWDIKEMRDVIMPGINDYRTDAARTGEHAGTSDPEFGPDMTETIDGVCITYPVWCRVTVKRQMPNGTIVEFSATERWKENYATKSSKSDAPNAMWKRRPYAQLAKCSEAQALRKGFPEVGNQPTADEMEGNEIDMGAAEVVQPRQPQGNVVDISQVTEIKTLPPYPQEKITSNRETWIRFMESGKKSKVDIIAMVSSAHTLSQEQLFAIDEMADIAAARQAGEE